MKLSAPFIQCRLRQEIMLYLVTFSGMAESEQGNTSSMANSRQEEDELLAQMEEDERLLDKSDRDDKQSTAMPK